jgi:hypothetical protein
MKFHQVGATMLVAWLLIMPPVSQDRRELDNNAPLSQWDTIGSYDDAAACKSEFAKLTAVIAGNISYSLVQRRALAGKCIAADDPRIHSDNFEMR